LTPPRNRRRQAGGPFVVAFALAAHAPPVLALGNDTVFLRGNALVGYDSNVFRVSEDIDPAVFGLSGKDDTYYGLGAGVRLDLPISRQRVRVDASATNYGYSRHDQLDYTGYAGRGTWDWRVGNDWYGEIGAGVRQTRQTATDALGFTIPRLLRTYNALANARYALTPRWELQAGGSAYQARYNDDRFRADDFDSTTWDLGAAYRTPRGNSTGMRLRYERGRWPNRSEAQAALLGEEYDQYTLSAVVDWRLTGRSRLYGDVGYTQRSRESAEQGDFSGPSGRLTYEYSLSGKTTLSGTIYQTRGPTDVDFATYSRTTGLGFSASHQLTGKIGLQGTLGYSEVEYLGEARNPGQSVREFHYWNIGVNGVYQITRTVYLNAAVNYYWRTSDLRFGDYEALTGNLGIGAEF
jgi:exopolysaccharide biosynthesis operon protein EpsL